MLAGMRGVEIGDAIDAEHHSLAVEYAAKRANAQPVERLSLRAPMRRGTPRTLRGAPVTTLLLRLSTCKEDVLRFLSDPDVPFTNNQAEQDGRMMKVKQKISGGFRSEDGANTFVINRTVISTAKKQGWNVLETLTQHPSTLIQSLRLA